jgi:phospholipase C
MILTKGKWTQAGLLVVALLSAGSLRAATGTIQDVKHVVILMQENRSFDHFFGTMQGVRGFNDPNIFIFPWGSSDLFQFPDSVTNIILPFPITNACVNDVDHNESTGVVARDSGWWDEWYQAKGTEAMAYYTRTNLLYYYSLADDYTVCDENFCSFSGATFANRIYLFTGMLDPDSTGGGPVLDDTIPTNGCNWTTYPERLQSAGVSWKVYRPPGDWYGDALQWFNNYQQASPGNPLYDRGMATVTNVIAAFAADVTNGTLPQVSWIIPTDLSWSGHPPFSIDRSAYFVNQALSALAANQDALNSTVFILTFDENGGFFDHVPSPVPPPGTPDEYVNGEPLGLGVRVPMIIVSPWTRGGRVCSQVFDHTSIIRFLETWTGVQEPNISAWRRQTCGDLTSAFDFTNPDFSFPSLPAPSAQNYPAFTPPVPAAQSVPVQEAGVRPACPLPYQPDAICRTDCNSNRLFVTMTNAGTASVHFAVYPNAYNPGCWWCRQHPSQYDALPGGSTMDSYAIPAAAHGRYDYTCYGPNGFQRHFAGNIQQDCNQIEVASLIDPTAGCIGLDLLNSSGGAVNFTVTDNLNSGMPSNFTLSAASVTNCAFFAVTNNNGWYDLTVTADADTNFLRHLAGHIETGAFSFTELPVIVGNILQVSTNTNMGSTNSAGSTSSTNSIASTNSTPPVIGSIQDLVNALIAENSLAIADTNVLALTIGSYGTNCALIFPGWASNYVVESSADLGQSGWTQLNAMTTTVSNCNVIILPETNTDAYFRLRQSQ